MTCVQIGEIQILKLTILVMTCCMRRFLILTTCCDFSLAKYEGIELKLLATN